MENSNLPYSKHSVLFAPMEGITDVAYREAVMRLFPEWDMFATDFLRIPTEGTISEKKAIEHIGEENLSNPCFKGQNHISDPNDCESKYRTSTRSSL